MYNFSDRYAVVTGAAQGIGFAVAKRFVEEGIAGVAILDWNAETVKKAGEELAAAGTSKVLALQCDVSNYEMVEGVMKQVEEEFGKIDILFNNAGITRDAMFHKMTLDQWNAVIGVNLQGVFNCTRTIINGMRNRGYGRIINMASKSVYGEVGQANYAATKAAMVGFTKTLAKEGARKGITCNAILPDFINTPMMNAIPEENMKMRLAQAPMQRMGEVSEVANLVMWLASDESSYVSGDCIDINGATRT